MFKREINFLLLLFLPWPMLGQTLTHRYSFFSEPNGSTVTTDLVAAANGTVQGSATISSGQLVLNGSSGTYLNLPGGLVNSSYSAITIETWASFGTLPVNSFFWGFGNTDASGSGEDYIFCAPQGGRIAITSADPGWQGEQNASSGVNWSGQSNMHIVAVFNPPASSIELYTNGVLAASNAITTAISSVNDVYSYVGRSLYTTDPYAPFNVAEFRIWNGALSAQQVAINAASGPSRIITSPGSLQSIQLQITNQVLAGVTQSIGLAGNFNNVSNVNLFTYGQPTLVSDNTNVIAVSNSGMITGITPYATANIIASYGGLTTTQSVTVAGFSTNSYIFDTFGDGFWSIINQANSNALVANFSAATQEAVTNGATEQQFEILYNLQNGTFRLRQRSNWYCLGALNNTAKPGGNAALAVFYTGTSAQQWYLVNAGNGYYRIFNAASNLVLQTDNGSPANVTLVPPSNSPAQFWQMTYQGHYPKKGCAGYEGDYSQFGLSWAYNYDDNTSVALPSSVVYEPMIWGPYWEPLSNVQGYYNSWHSTTKPTYLMTFNEPDNSSQANMSTNTAISMWPALQNMNLPLVSPAMQNTYDAWAYNFFSLIVSNNYRVDYTAVHLYVAPNSTSFINNLEAVYTTWGRPVWLTEFSPVDWSGNQGWTEDDDFNFLAEFMWMAEDNDWLKRYAIFPFSGTNSLPPWQSTTAGYRGNFFEADGVTLTPYGELYASWDADRTLRARTPYFLHNLGTSFRLTDTNSANGVTSSSILVRNAPVQWALLPAATTNLWYIISLNDGRRLNDSVGTLALSPVGSTGATLEWAFIGPDSQGYYFVSNNVWAQNINGAGTAPAITFGTVSSATQNNNTRWRLIKPYQPVSIVAPTVPNLSAIAGNQAATLNWNSGNTFYNVYRSTISGGPYVKIASAITNMTYTDSNLNNGTIYYYVVTGMSILGEESSYSSEVNARPVSMVPAQLSFSLNNLSYQLNWPGDHIGWKLQVQTNSPNAGLGTNWFTVPGSNATNYFALPININNNSVFFRLIYP